jgi:hypothetical protein
MEKFLKKPLRTILGRENCCNQVINLSWLDILNNLASITISHLGTTDQIREHHPSPAKIHQWQGASNPRLLGTGTRNSNLVKTNSQADISASGSKGQQK